MANKENTELTFPDSRPKAGDPLDLEGNPILVSSDPKVRDVIVFGPILTTLVNPNPTPLEEFKPWTIGMRGYRRSRLLNKSIDDEVTADEAKKFVLKYIEKLRSCPVPLADESGKRVDTTTMDVEIVVPTLLVVVSPTPNLIFDDPPISGKVKFKEKKFTKIDPNCPHPPKLWFYKGNHSGWECKEPTILSWISTYDHSKMPANTLSKREEHNYHMTFKSIAYDSCGVPYFVNELLPIIFDPGNNNGGVGSFP